MSFHDEIREKLGTKKFLKKPGSFSGCISQGHAYECDDKVVFIKTNEKEVSRFMFEGEMESLKAIAATKTVRVPQVYLVHSDLASSQSAIVMEYIDNMRSLRKFASKLGESLATLHLHNINVGKRLAKEKNWVGKGRDDEESYITQFGFHCNTCCGSIPMINEWTSDWVSFYARFRLEDKIKSLLETNTDRELNELWSKLQLIVPNFFKDTTEKKIIPSLLHGDLWRGNAAETETEAVTYDPASFYGHSEFDLGDARIFGGLGHQFYASYHLVIKKAPGFDKREGLYELFHYLNHWQHFGTSYRPQSINLMKKLCKMF